MIIKNYRSRKEKKSILSSIHLQNMKKKIRMKTPTLKLLPVFSRYSENQKLYKDQRKTKATTDGFRIFKISCFLSKDPFLIFDHFLSPFPDPNFYTQNYPIPLFFYIVFDQKVQMLKVMFSSELIELQQFQVGVPMNKIDRIRRKLEENKMKSLFGNIKINQNLPTLSQQKNHSTNSQLNTFSVFPIISKANVHQISTNHSDRSQQYTEPSQTETSFFSGRKTYGIAVLGAGVKRRGKKLQHGEKINELQAKSLNPSVRINWACPKSSQTTSLKNGENCIISAQTPKTVIIHTQPYTPSGTLRSTFRMTAPKRHSVIVRNTYTPQKEASPSRKFSISAWQTFDE